jgi:hypothetical protein
MMAVYRISSNLVFMYFSTIINCNFLTYIYNIYINLTSSYLIIVGVEVYYCGWSHSMTHTQTHTFGWTPLNEGSARRRDLYLTTHNTNNRQTTMPQWDSNPQSLQANCRRLRPSVHAPIKSLSLQSPISVVLVFQVTLWLGSTRGRHDKVTGTTNGMSLGCRRPPR